MSYNFKSIALGCAGAALSFALAPDACAQAEAAPAPAEAPAAAEVNEPSPEEAQKAAELKNELAYIEALIDNGFANFAEPVIEATKKKWPESEIMLFAMEVRALLLRQKFDEAEKKVASVPDRKSSKYWAAKIEIANYYFIFGRKTESSAIYNEFFKTFPKPPKELREFYLQASYSYGQLLIADKHFKDAAKHYMTFLDMLDRKRSDDDYYKWGNVACETAEIYLRLANECEKPADRKPYIDAAKKLVNQLLWMQDQPVFFGRAIAMKANIELLNGSVAKAQATIDDYMDQLSELHKQLVELDPDGKLSLLKQSPMPLCRYMLAEMLWKEAQAEYKKPKRNDERVKSLMFGEKGPNGKRKPAGAYNHALNVFIQYPESPWAPKAGPLADEIEAFAIKNYEAKIQKKVTDEQMAKVRKMQFANANGKYGEGLYEEAIKDYTDVLSSYPEFPESIGAVENIANAYVRLISRSKDENKKAEWRINADAVEGYLAERFGGSKNKSLMMAAGDAVQRLAAQEKQMGELARADALYRAFLTNYRRHLNAAMLANGLAQDAYTSERYVDALDIYNIIDKYYSNSVYITSAVIGIGRCNEKLGNRKAAIDAYSRYLTIEKSPIKNMQAQMQLALLYQRDGLDILKEAESGEGAEAEAKLKEGSAQIIRGIQKFTKFTAECDKMLADPAVSTGDKKSYMTMKESALYVIGNCWMRLKKPEDKLEGYRKKAAEAFENYVAAFPAGDFARFAYLNLGTIYTATGDIEKAKVALDSLAREFPDSPEAKNSKPRLAKAMIEMGMQDQGTKIYAEMLTVNGEYNARQFVDAGEALITARSWDLANQAFEKAKRTATTNQNSVIARANIGLARSLHKQKSNLEAYEALTELLVAKKGQKKPRLSSAIAEDANRLMAEVASDLGMKEKVDKQRARYFASARSAIKGLRVAKKNQKRPATELDEIDLLATDITIRRMNAELDMGLDEQAMESCESASTALQAFRQSHYPDQNHPIEKFTPAELKNLEHMYTSLVPCLVRLGDRQKDNVLKFGSEYMRFFPEGKDRINVQNAVNQAIANGAKMPEEEAAPAAAPDAEKDEAEEGEEPAEGESAPDEGGEDEGESGTEEPVIAVEESAGDAPAAVPAPPPAPAAEAEAGEKTAE